MFKNETVEIILVLALYRDYNLCRNDLKALSLPEG
jgi:hypothetical protein